MKSIFSAQPIFVLFPEVEILLVLKLYCCNVTPVELFMGKYLSNVKNTVRFNSENI